MMASNLVTTKLGSAKARIGSKVQTYKHAFAAGIPLVPLTHGSLPCSVPEDMSPLFDLLDTTGELALVAGVGIGTIGLLVAAVLMMWPSQDSTQRGKEIAKHVIIGAVLLLSANMIMSFLVMQLGTSICS